MKNRVVELIEVEGCWRGRLVLVEYPRGKCWRWYLQERVDQKSPWHTRLDGEKVGKEAAREDALRVLYLHINKHDRRLING